ncbi:response regulator transcription factor [Pseudomonas sp. NPDC078700]|uniref:response regulator transcription factor n=1 Tax=Pseudomonas sp. NPDC078700 TaxID=3364424 RepID=UPI0037C7BE9E
MTSGSVTAHILAIEDDPVLSVHLQEHLCSRGFQVTLHKDGKAGLAQGLTQPFDLVLLDILLPNLDGLNVLEQLRHHSSVPVILISALGAEQDRIAGFSQGADDYLPKPFTMAELEVRIAAIMRRVAYERGYQKVAAQIPSLELSQQQTDVRHQNQWAQLTTTEFRLLELLIENAGEVLSKAFLYQQVLHRAYSQHDRSLDMHISHVRRKLSAIGYLSGRVETAWGKGYVFELDPS